MAIFTQMISYPFVYEQATLEGIVDALVSPGWLVPDKFGKLSESRPLSARPGAGEMRQMFDFYLDNPSLTIYGKRRRGLIVDKFKARFKYQASIYHYSEDEGAKEFRLDDYDATIGQMMHLVKGLYGECQLTGAKDHYWKRLVQRERFKEEIFTVKDAGEGLTNPAWKMWLGERYIKAFGREKLLTTPCHRVKELGPVIFIQLFEDPADWNSQKTLETVEQFKRHVGYDYFYDPAKPNKRLLTPDFSDL